jgi:hypothetical protein
MEIALDAELYCPSVNDNGQYVDTTSAFKGGMRCPCGSRKDKIYTTTTAWKSHIRTDTHRRWLTDLNANKANHFMELVNLRELVGNQRLIIARLERDMNRLTNKPAVTAVENLIDI